MDRAAKIREQVARHGFALSRTFGRSMRPLIWGGVHTVVVVPLDGEPALGELLMFVQPSGGEGRSVVHRVVEIRDADSGRLVITRGDNNVGTERVRPEEIIGRVAEIHRTSGFRPWHILPKKRIAVTDRSYRLYSRFWTAIWPMRRFIFRLRGYFFAALRRGKA